MLNITSIVDAFLPEPCKVYGIVIGLTKVNPLAYNGWNGDCPGCDIDANNFVKLLTSMGIPYVKLFNQEATIANVKKTVIDVWATIKRNDLLVFYMSGHGGQVPDMNGDEADGRDETLCLWDGQLVDDSLYELWSMAPDGIRAFYVTDCCNSGSNFRAMPQVLPRQAILKFNGQLIHYGGCPDGNYSYGGSGGGVFTSALMSTYNVNHTYKTWFEAATRLMPPNQIPVYAEYGDVNEAFRNAKLFK